MRLLSAIKAPCPSGTVKRVRICVLYSLVCVQEEAGTNDAESSQPLYGKSPLWVIRLLVAKHRYIAFGVAQRASLPPRLRHPRVVLAVRMCTWYVLVCVCVCDRYGEFTFLSLFRTRVSVRTRIYCNIAALSAHGASWALERHRDERMGHQKGWRRNQDDDMD